LYFGARWRFLIGKDYGASDHRQVGQAGKREPRNGAVYERRRLLQRPSRSIAGYRVFSDEAVQRLRFIRHAQSLGFSLEEIRELLALRVRSIDACDRVRERTQTKISAIEWKIDALQRIKRSLSELVTACSRRRKTEECPILDCLEDN
jgi:MerR family mercuric resistance operon transcriptional regulator